MYGIGFWRSSLSAPIAKDLVPVCRTQSNIFRIAQEPKSESGASTDGNSEDQDQRVGCRVRKHLRLYIVVLVHSKCLIVCAGWHGATGGRNHSLSVDYKDFDGIVVWLENVKILADHSNFLHSQWEALTWQQFCMRCSSWFSVVLVANICLCKLKEFLNFMRFCWCLFFYIQKIQEDRGVRGEMGGAILSCWLAHFLTLVYRGTFMSEVLPVCTGIIQVLWTWTEPK